MRSTWSGGIYWLMGTTAASDDARIVNMNMKSIVALIDFLGILTEDREGEIKREHLVVSDDRNSGVYGRQG